MRLVHSKDRSVIWTCFLMKIVGLWIATDRNEQRHRNIALIYTVWALSVATCIALRDLYFSWGNFDDCVNVCCNILYLNVAFFKIVVLYSHKRRFYDLVMSTEQSAVSPSNNREEQKILMNCKRLCDRFIVFITVCVQGTCAGYAVTPILENIGKNQSERILPFNLWVDFPTGTSPYFEVLFIIQMLCVYHVAITYFCFDNLLCIVCLNVAGQFRILQHRLTRLSREMMKQTENPDCAIKYRMMLKDCIRHHQALIDYCKKLENVFTLIILGEVMFLAMLLCFVGVQIFLLASPPARRVSLFMSMMGVCSQLFMFTYCWDGLIRESGNIGQAAFAGPWCVLPTNKPGRALRTDIFMIIMRSGKCCRLTAGGFFIVSLETCTSVLSTAISYFTLLRQSAPDLTNT